MGRKTLVLGLVLMALGVVVGGAIENRTDEGASITSGMGVICEEGKYDLVHGAYLWYKTRDWKQAFYGAVAGGLTLEVSKEAGKTLARYATKRIIRRVAIRTAVKFAARAVPVIGVGLAM